MTNKIYIINRAVNKPIEFKGLRAQYILYAGGVIVGSLLLFILLYICRVSTFLCAPMCLGIGAAGVTWTYRMSNRYGEYGRAKKSAASSIPDCIHYRTRSIFIQLKKQS